MQNLEKQQHEQNKKHNVSANTNKLSNMRVKCLDYQEHY